MVGKIIADTSFKVISGLWKRLWNIYNFCFLRAFRRRGESERIRFFVHKMPARSPSVSSDDERGKKKHKRRDRSHSPVPEKRHKHKHKHRSTSPETSEDRHKKRKPHKDGRRDRNQVSRWARGVQHRLQNQGGNGDDGTNNEVDVQVSNLQVKKAWWSRVWRVCHVAHLSTGHLYPALNCCDCDDGTRRRKSRLFGLSCRVDVVKKYSSL